GGDDGGGDAGRLFNHHPALVEVAQEAAEAITGVSAERARAHHRFAELAQYACDVDAFAPRGFGDPVDPVDVTPVRVRKVVGDIEGRLGRDREDHGGSLPAALIDTVRFSGV